MVALKRNRRTEPWTLPILGRACRSALIFHEDDPFPNFVLLHTSEQRQGYRKVYVQFLFTVNRRGQILFSTNYPLWGDRPGIFAAGPEETEHPNTK